MVISTRKPGSPFWPLCMPSGCKCYCMLMEYLPFQHQFCYRMYVLSFQYHIVTLTWCCDMCSWYFYSILFFPVFSQILITCRKYFFFFLATPVVCHSQKFCRGLYTGGVYDQYHFPSLTCFIFCNL